MRKTCSHEQGSNIKQVDAKVQQEATFHQDLIALGNTFL